MADLSALHGRVALNVPAAPGPIIQTVILDAVQEFCRRTRCWRTPFTVEIGAAGDVEHTVSVPADTVLVEPISAELNGASLPKHYVRITGLQQITFPDLPGLRGTVTGELAVEPTDDAEEIPDQLMREHRDAFVNGALARLQRIPNVPWSAPGLGEQKLMEFEHAIDAAEYRAADGYLKGRPRTVRYGGL